MSSRYFHSFSNRMKEYEWIYDYKLTNRLPVIIRLDGNSFSKFTYNMNFEKPFDDLFIEAMGETTKNLLKYCSGSQVGYFQSDEITLLLRNDIEQNTDPFLSNRIQKICSLLGGLASVTFSNFLNKKITNLERPISEIFDCRVFIVPREEVNNVFLWRQQDAFRNAVSSFAYYKLAEKYDKAKAQTMMFKKSTAQLQEIIYSELGVNINDIPTKYRRGICVIKTEKEKRIEDVVNPDVLIKFPEKKGTIIKRSDWDFDYDIPKFNENKEYITKFLKYSEKKENKNEN